MVPADDVPPGPIRNPETRGVTPLTPRDPERDSALAYAIAQGDAEALKTLFQLYYEELRLYAASIVNDTTIAEDIVQDIFLRLWSRGAEWIPEGDGVIRYLFGAVRNHAIDVLRTDRRHETLLARETQPEAFDAVGTANLEATELAATVQQVIDSLPDRCREVFVLSRMRRFSQREISDLLGITVNTVNVQLGRALRAIRTAVRTFEDGR